MLNMKIKINFLVDVTWISKCKILKGPNISEFRNPALQKSKAQKSTRAIKDSNYLPQTSLHKSKIIRSLK